MSTNGEGEWAKWQNSSYWGAKFIWTTLHDFGGTNGMKGDLRRVNRIPYAGLKDPRTRPTRRTHAARSLAAAAAAGGRSDGDGYGYGPNNSTVWGTGFTPGRVSL